MTTVATPVRWTPDAIRDLRKRLRMTQEEMARQLGYGRSRSIGDLEKGRSEPSGSVQVLLDIIDANDGLPRKPSA